MTQPPNPGDPQGQPGGYQPPQPPQEGGYQPPQPPQQPGYQPPPQGGFQPPQPGYQQPGYQQPGYQQPPQGYAAPPPGYAPQGGGAADFNVGEAFSWAWNKFTKNAVPLIVAIIGYAIALGAVLGIVWAIAISLGTKESITSPYSGQTFESDTTTLGAGSFIVLLIGYLIALVLGAVFASGFINSLLKIADGQQVDIASFFKPRNLTQVILAALILGIASAIGSIVFIGGILVALFGLYTMWAVVDRDLPAIEGLKTSFNLVKDNFVTALITYFLGAIIAAVGLLLCGIGGLVSIPVAALFTAYSWRHVSRGQIAPLTP